MMLTMRTIAAVAGTVLWSKADDQLAFGSPRWTLRPDRGMPLPSRE
jgi:hypothetical protein